MKTTSIISLTLAAVVSASPFQTRDTEPITLALSNDLTRSYATAKVATDNLPHSIGVLFAGTGVNDGGIVKASSAQLVTVPAGINCVITNEGETIATLTAENTYADLDGNPNESVPVNLMGARVTCHL